MKNAHPIKDEVSAPGQSAPIVASPGTLPCRKNTVLAAVLCHLLADDKLTGLDAVFGAGTTRLAAVIHALTKDYGWTVERADKVVACKDGHVQTVAEYHLLPSIISDALRNGAAAWCGEVRAARAELRSQAAAAQRAAAQANAARNKRNRQNFAADQADLLQPCGGVAAW